jgi:hypothetical protein
MNVLLSQCPSAAVIGRSEYDCELQEREGRVQSADLGIRAEHVIDVSLMLIGAHSRRPEPSPEVPYLGSEASSGRLDGFERMGEKCQWWSVVS